MSETRRDFLFKRLPQTAAAAVLAGVSAGTSGCSGNNLTEEQKLENLNSLETVKLTHTVEIQMNFFTSRETTIYRFPNALVVLATTDKENIKDGHLYKPEFMTA